MYQKTIEMYMYVKKSYLREGPKDKEPPPGVWYLPQVPIVRMSKTTTKVRIVFDCSTKYNGMSLNDVIHVEPKLQ